MELRHLRYVAAVAEEGHITRAAERLGIQQPPLSRQIKAIEQEIGVRLFRRKPRGVELTDGGHAFLDGVRSIFATLDVAVETTRRAARGEQGRLAVGCTNAAVLNPLLVTILRDFRKAFPLVTLSLSEDSSSDLIELVENSRVDVAFVRTSLADPKRLVIDQLQNEPQIVALPRGSALAGGKTRRSGAPLSLKDLVGQTLLVFGGPRGTFTFQGNVLIAACEEAGFKPHIRPVASNTLPRLTLVAAGLGIAVVPASVERVNIEGVIYRSLRNAERLASPLNLVSRRSETSPVVRQFLRFAKQAAKKFGHEQ